MLPVHARRGPNNRVGAILVAKPHQQSCALLLRRPYYSKAILHAGGGVVGPLMPYCERRPYYSKAILHAGGGVL
jgi:hypothetical protein